MASIIDRLLGRTETKAITGPGAYAMATYPALKSLSRDPNRLMAEGMALYRTQPWVNAAERALGGRFVRMDWHLEQDDGDTVGDDASPQEKAVLDLLERPSPGKTRRQLWGLTFRHIGLAGNAIWYLDQTSTNPDGSAGAPLAIRYINPARMTVVCNASDEIIGWILDDPSNPVSGSAGRRGVPFDATEIIHFTLDEPDWGSLGVGIPEAAQRKIELDRLSDSHSGGVFGSGGRLTGLIAPKAGVQVQDEQWVQFTRDWRRITEDPDAAKRLQVAKMPLDFTQMSATPKDLQLLDVSKQGRDDILAIWGVPKSQLGIDTPAGLNSDRSVGDEAALWETVKARAEGMREKIQFEFLDRFGLGLQLVFDYPQHDDNKGRFENAALARTIPMTIDQRLEQVGLDPLPSDVYGDLGRSIYLDQSMVRVDTVGVPPVAPVNLVPNDQTLPPPPHPVGPAPVPPAAKARLDATRLRANVEKRYTGRLQTAMRTVLADQRGDVVRYVRKNYEHLAAKAKDTDAWWSATREDKRLATALLPIYDELATETTRNIRATFAFPAKADSGLEAVLRIVRQKAADRIKGINQTTRDALAKIIADGVAEGYTLTDLAANIEGATAFDAARADLVARTETMLAYNESALSSYQAFDVAEVQAIDGDADDECASRDGRIYSVDDAYGIQDHPNGTLDWVPIVKAVVEPEKPDPVQELLGMFKAVLERPAPPITIHPADVHVYNPEQKPAHVSVNPEIKATLHMDPPPPSTVTVNVPEQPPAQVTVNMPEAKATGPAEVVVTQMPGRIHKALRDADGQIIGSIEGDQ